MLDAVAVIALILLAYWLGWNHRSHWEWIKGLGDHLATTKKTAELMPTSSIIEPRYETPSEKALREQKELTDSLNAPMS